jgi:predicted CoA-binding protein
MKTLVVGASPNDERYSYKAVRMLKRFGHEVIPLGLRKGNIEGEEIVLERHNFDDIHTVTMYVGRKKQAAFYDYILSLHPKRIIFNPGTENMEFANLAENKGIETVMNCTLVMLSKGIY